MKTTRPRIAFKSERARRQQALTKRATAAQDALTVLGTSAAWKKKDELLAQEQAVRDLERSLTTVSNEVAYRQAKIGRDGTLLKDAARGVWALAKLAKLPTVSPSVFDEYDPSLFAERLADALEAGGVRAESFARLLRGICKQSAAEKKALRALQQDTERATVALSAAMLKLRSKIDDAMAFVHASVPLNSPVLRHFKRKPRRNRAGGGDTAAAPSLVSSAAPANVAPHDHPQLTAAIASIGDRARDRTAPAPGSGEPAPVVIQISVPAGESTAGLTAT